jgi:hypothetical protein
MLTKSYATLFLRRALVLYMLAIEHTGKGRGQPVSETTVFGTLYKWPLVARLLGYPHLGSFQSARVRQLF